MALLERLPAAGFAWGPDFSLFRVRRSPPPTRPRSCDQNASVALPQASNGHSNRPPSAVPPACRKLGAALTRREEPPAQFGRQCSASAERGSAGYAASGVARKGRSSNCRALPRLGDPGTASETIRNRAAVESLASAISDVAGGRRPPVRGPMVGAAADPLTKPRRGMRAVVFRFPRIAAARQP